MTLLTSVKILTPLSAMALHDGRGFADLPEKLKALRIFTHLLQTQHSCHLLLASIFGFKSAKLC